MRVLVAIVSGIAALAAGYLVLLNDAPVVVRFSPGQTATAPLAIALLAAFATGALLVTLVAGAGAVSRGARAWRVRRRTRREARASERTAQARELLWTGAPTAARAALGRSGRGADDDPGRIALLAEAHLQEDDAAGARALLDAALPRVGPDPHLLDLLAEAATRLDDGPGAIDALERARLGRPASPRLLRRLRDLQIAAGRWEAALPLQAEIVLHQHTPAALASETALLRGIRYEVTLARVGDDPRPAARELAAMARESPEFVPAWVSAGDLLAQAGRTVRARWLWERGLKRTGHPILAERLGVLNAAAARPDRTVRALQRARRRHPDDPRLLGLLTHQLLELGRLDEVEALLDLAGPSPARTLARGALERRRGNFERAAELFAEGVSAGAGYACAACHRPSAGWAGACPACRRWGTIGPR